MPKKTHSTLDSTVAEVRALLKQVHDKLEELNLARLTAEERLHSNGRLRAGEDDAMISILDTMDASPASFAALADKDHGTDPEVLETAPTRAVLARRSAMLPVAADLQALSNAVGDDILQCGELARDVTIPAYAIAKPIAALDATIRKILGPALDFFASAAKHRKPPARDAATQKTS